MGMYDNVAYEAPCPLCGTALPAWQSKDGRGVLQTLTPPELREQTRYRDDMLFYSNCDNCGTWVDIHVRARRPQPTSKERARMTSLLMWS